MSVGQQNITDEARRYFDRGTEAMEMAKSAADYDQAIMEFKRAAGLAPEWSELYRQLAAAQEKAGKYGDAMTSLKQYLRLSPNASDAEMVRSLVNKLEYRNEKQEKNNRLYEAMTKRTNLVHWVKISMTGDDEPDWEIDHNNDFDYAKKPEERNESIYYLKNGTLYKVLYAVYPKNTFLDPSWHGDIAVKIDGSFFEYRYPFKMFRDVNNTIVESREGGELSIKGEIVSTDPPRIKREQQVKWPDGRTSVTEFMYELQFA